MSLENFFTPYSAIDCLPGKTIAVLAPHPDDEVFGCGGALHALIQQGAQVQVVVVSDGASHGTSDAQATTRVQESCAAAAILGYPEPTFWTFSDGHLYDEQGLLPQVKQWLAELQPDLVIAPSLWEMHRDHRAVAIAAQQAMSVLAPESQLAMYEIGVPLVPNTLLNITPQAALKEQAMACFDSQLAMQSYAQQINGLNTFRTYTLPKSVHRVEAYHLLQRDDALNFNHQSTPQQHDEVLRQSGRLLENMQAENRRLAEQVALGEQLSRSQQERDKLLQDLQQTQQRLHSIEQELQGVYGSSSWFITKPLRVIRRIATGQLSLTTALKVLLKTLWRALPLPHKLKTRLRCLPQRLRKSFERLSYSSNNVKASRRLLERRHLATDQAYPHLDEMTPIAIDLSIVTYNSTPHLVAFIDSLIAQNYPTDQLHLTFVDNASKDHTLSMLADLKAQHQDKFARFSILERENRGFGAGHNAGIHEGDTDFILVVNPDIEFAKDMLEQIVADAQCSDDKVACWEARQKPYEHPKLYDPVSLEVNWCSHACVLLRRSAIERIGFYDERIFLYGEDVEVSYRLREAGFSLKYVPKSVVWHYTYESAGEIKPAQYVGSIIGNFFLRTRYGTLGDRFSIIPLFLILLMRSPFAGARRKLIKDFIHRYLRFVPQLLIERKNSDGIPFSFRLLDYEKQRHGAFWQGQPIDALPLVSIITRTVANRGELLKQAGFSVFNQTYPNIEWVVVEDGGIENKEAQRPFIQGLTEHPGMQVAYQPLAKLGRSAAGNRGMEIARGEYLMFLDDDDCLYADHVETLMAEIKAQPHCVAAYSLAWEVESHVENGGAQITEGSYHQVNSLKQSYNYSLLRNGNYIPIQSILFEAALFQQRGGFDVALDYLEDWHLWQRYAHGNQFSYVPKTTSMYRTPLNMNLRSERQALLNGAYNEVKQQAAKDIEALDIQLTKNDSLEATAVTQMSEATELLAADATDFTTHLSTPTQRKHG